jgi:hypothetical protein
MASVKERLELLQVERGKLIEDNRLLTESQRKLGEKLAACEVRLQVHCGTSLQSCFIEIPII